MRDTSSPRDVAHVYEDVSHAADRPSPHRVDVIDAAAWPKPRPTFAPQLVSAPVASPPIRHQLESPARVGFGLGFGFAAGMWTFRATTTVVAGIALLVAIWHLVSIVLH